MILKVEEFQEMESETVNENERASLRFHVMNSKLFRAYDSKYMRGDKKPLHVPQYEAYDLHWSEKLLGLLLPFTSRIFPSPEDGLRSLRGLIGRSRAVEPD